MKMKRAVLLVGLLLTALFVTVGSVSARPVLATTISTTCVSEPGTEWMTGNVYHVRGQVNTAVEQSDNPMLNGVGTIVVNFDLNVADGSGRTWGTWVNEAENYDGTWRGVYRGMFENFVPSIHSMATGTGELRGIKRIGHYQGPTNIPEPAPCENPIDAETWMVIVIEQ